MGSRHNRKRTRSRPRNRRRSSLPAPPSLSFDSAPFPGPYAYAYAPFPDPAGYDARSASPWHDTVPWHDPRPGAVDAHCVRLFGGHPGEERSLCAPMLQVVMGLFNGDLDYDDP